MGRFGQDTFTRANQSNFGTASDGQTWTTTGTGTLSIASNEGLLVSAGTDTHVQLGNHTSADMIVMCRIAISDPTDVCGVQGRFTAASGTTAYKLVWYGGNVHLNKCVVGTTTQLTSVAFTMTPGTFYWFKLLVLGSNQYGKIWQSGSAEPGSWTTTLADTSVTGTGGFAILGQTNGASTGIQYDNFSALPYTAVVRSHRRALGRVA